MLSGFPNKLPMIKSVVAIKSVGTIAVVPPMLTFVILNQKKEKQPPTIDKIAPVEFAFFQKSANKVGQRKTASKPPNAKRLIQTKRAGGFNAAKKTIRPTKAVTIRLMWRILFGGRESALFFAM